MAGTQAARNLVRHNGYMTLTQSSNVAPLTRAPMRIAVVDPGGQLDDLASFLPVRWSTRQCESLYAVPACHALVIVNATPSIVAGARLVHPDATIVAIIDAQVPIGVFVAILRAGADACLRTGSSLVVAGHLLASHRRRTAKSPRPARGLAA